MIPNGVCINSQISVVAMVTWQRLCEESKLSILMETQNDGERERKREREVSRVKMVEAEIDSLDR